MRESSVGSTGKAGPWPRLALGLILLLAVLFFFTGLRGSGFADNEGRYAEVAREILETGDWVTPHLNGAVFLNKPPLMFWLTALSFRLFGPYETARWISGLATLGTALLLYALGRKFRSPYGGEWAEVVFLTSALTTVEARLLRPDSLLVFFLLLTLWGVLRATERPGDRWGQIALWGGIGCGIMTKGLLGLLLPLLAVGPAYLLASPRPRLRHYFSFWGVGLVLAIVLPWHVAAGLVNPGFWWDYVVNQHLLFFFDQKLPRDSIPDPLWYSWLIFACRVLPWVLFLPAAIRLQFRRACEKRRLLDWLPLTWLVSILLFFSLAMGRLEHHLIPAVPAAALLIGRWCSETCERKKSWAMGWLSMSALSLLAIAGFVLAPRILTKTEFATELPKLLPLVRQAMGVLVIGCLAAAVAAWHRRPMAALVVLSVTFSIMGGFSAAGFTAVEGWTSVRSLVRDTDSALLRESSIAYEAGEEYQLCGALNFYLGQPVTLLEPPGFVPPTYFTADARRMFAAREEFAREWRSGTRRWLLFTDPDKPLERWEEYPQPYFVVGRGGGQLLLTNRPLSAVKHLVP